MLAHASLKVFHGEIANHRISVPIANRFQEVRDLLVATLNFGLDATIIQVLDETGQVMMARGTRDEVPETDSLHQS